MVIRKCDYPERIGFEVVVEVRLGFRVSGGR